MNPEALLPDGFSLYHLPTTLSTNDDCFALAETGAADGCVVVADEQTHGRGRLGHYWFSTPCASLTFSLLVRPTHTESPYISRFTALGGLALVHVLREHYHLPALIKWPNDVLIRERKVCGILTETTWQDSQPLAVILGVGINLDQAALPRAENLAYPATSLAAEIGFCPDRWELLERLLSQIQIMRQQLCEDTFIQDWNNLLIFIGEWVNIKNQGETGRFRLVEVCLDGALLVEDSSGTWRKLYSGDVST